MNILDVINYVIWIDCDLEICDVFATCEQRICSWTICIKGDCRPKNTQKPEQDWYEVKDR